MFSAFVRLTPFPFNEYSWIYENISFLNISEGDTGSLKIHFKLFPSKFSKSGEHIGC